MTRGEVLYSHPSVLYAAAIGVPVPGHGELVKALDQSKAGKRPVPEELRGHFARALARFKVPVAVEARETLPVPDVGKVLREVLAEKAIGTLRTRLSYQPREIASCQ